MYHVPSDDHQHPALVASMQFMLIVVPIGISDMLVGDAFWYLDRFLLMLLIAYIHRCLFPIRPALGRWLLCIVSALFVMMLVEPIVDAIVRVTIRDPYFPQRPNTRADSRYLFIDRLIVNSVLGSIIGTIQWIVLKKEGVSLRWWIPMTISAYALTTVSWYMYVLR
jgi:hypothetical protein